MGSPIGEQLLRSPSAKLVIDSSLPIACHGDVQALLNWCGRRNGKDRPSMERVLREVKHFLRVQEKQGISQGRTTPVPDSAEDRSPPATPLPRWERERAPFAAVTPPRFQRELVPAAAAQRVAPQVQRRPVPVSAASAAAIRVHNASTDRVALMGVYSATKGPPKKKLVGVKKHTGWKRREGWGTSCPLAEWHGVTVDDQGRVVKLDLSENNLKGEDQSLFS